MSITNLIKDAISLTSDVERLGFEVKDIAQEMRQIQSAQTERIHTLDKRVAKLENMIEFAERFTRLQKH